jgi:diphthine-ammonia ligase
MDLIGSWSGGKDSCLACYKAMKRGDSVRYLLNLVSKESGRCCFHGMEGPLLKLQAELIGIPLFQKEISQEMERYETEFKEAVTEIKGKSIEGMVFGDIYLDEHKDWVDRVCHDLEIVSVEPLWNQSPLALAEEFIDLGFQGVIVSCKADILGRDFIGRCVDREVLKELQTRQICPCGENGEFHTLVIDGPIFKRKIELLESEPILKDGFWKHWFLDIKSYR